MAKTAKYKALKAWFGYKIELKHIRLVFASLQ